MAQIERKRVVESEGTLPDGREVKHVVETERVVATRTEARGATTGHGASTVLLVSLGAVVLAMVVIWYIYFS